MKTTSAIVRGLLLGAVLVAIASLSSCVTTETFVTSPDGTTTHTKTTAPADGSMAVAGSAVAAAGHILADK